MKWYFTVTRYGVEQGTKDYGPYATQEEAFAGIDMAMELLFLLRDGIERGFSLPWCREATLETETPDWTP